jgi:hypothetical protein
MKPEKPVARRGDYTFLPEIPLGVAIPHISERHYAKGAAKTAAALHGLLRAQDGVLVGVAHWLPPTPVAQRWTLQQVTARTGRTFAEDDWKRVVALSRLAVTEGEPQNTASMLIGRSVRELRRSRRWVALLTYADTSQEHTGAIYRATNWIYCGLSKPKERWVDQNGKQISIKMGPRTRSREQMLALGYTCEGRFAKHAFVLPLR